MYDVTFINDIGRGKLSNFALRYQSSILLCQFLQIYLLFLINSISS